MTSCTPGVSSHILGMLVRLSPVNSVPFPFRPLDCLPHMMSSRVNYRHSRCLISLCVPGVTHCAWHRAAAHCLALTCMMEIRCVLIDHARPQPGDRRCWCDLGLAAAPWKRAWWALPWRVISLHQPWLRDTLVQEQLHRHTGCSAETWRRCGMMGRERTFAGPPHGLGASGEAPFSWVCLRSEEQLPVIVIEINIEGT